MPLALITYCIVGCNTGAESGETMHVLECNTETGDARIIQTVSGVQGTTYFQIDRDRKNLYTMIGEKRETKSVGSIVRFAIDGHRLGAMTKLCDLPCEAPCHIALSPDGRTLGFAAYLSATCGTVGIDGRGLKTYVFPDDAMGSRKDRQQKAYAHQAVFTDPQGVGPAMMGVVDLGCDRIRFFDPATMKPNVFEIRFDSGDGPRHAIFAPGSGNRVLYVVDELGSTVSSFAFDGANFKRLGKWSMLPADTPLKPADTKAAAIKLTADGKILMASNRGDDSIAFYETTPEGTLKLKNIAKLAGKFPRDFELMPGEKFMVVGHKMSNEIQVYAFDREHCTLTPVHAPIPCWRPLCFKFLQPDTKAPSMQVVEIKTQEQFENEVLKSAQPTVVDFWATWCGPCRMMAPVMHSLAESRADLKVCKVNVDELGDLAAKYGIMSIPCVILFRAGEPKAQSVGFMKQEELVAALGL